MIKGKNVVALVVVLCMISCMAGCGKTIKNAATIAGAGTVTYQTFDSVGDIIRNNTDVFSPREIVRLRSAGETLTEVKARIDSMIAEHGDALGVVSSLSDLIPLYKQAKIAYGVADKIVMDRIDEFNPQEQMILYTFQESCKRLDGAITEAINCGGVDNAQTVKDILSFALLVGKVIVPLIIL